MTRRFTVGAAVVVLGASLLAACGDQDDADDAGANGTGTTGERTVEVAMLDDFRFEPDTLEAQVGATVTFVVTNEGEIVHDFSLGEMEHDMMEDAADAIVLGPGETGELTYTFDEAGTVEFGCHQPGHLEAGMVLTVSVT